MLSSHGYSSKLLAWQQTLCVRCSPLAGLSTGVHQPRPAKAADIGSRSRMLPYVLPVSTFVQHDCWVSHSRLFLQEVSFTTNIQIAEHVHDPCRTWETLLLSV